MTRAARRPWPFRASAACFCRALPVALVVLSFGASAAAMPFDPGDAGWEGTRGFLTLAQETLGEGRVKAVTTLDWSVLTAADGLLVLHPERVLDGDELAAFLRGGGRVAVLDDYGVGDRTLQRYQIKRVPPPTTPLLTLRDNPALPIAEPVTETVGGRPGPPHPVAAEVTRLVTNHPTGFVHPDLSPVLRIRSRDDADVTLAVAGQVGKGRLLAMGDPSAVINVMLSFPGNRAFAVGLVKYLVDDDTWGPRQGKLYIIVDRFEERGTFAGEASSREMHDALRTLKAILRQVETEGLPRGALVALGVAALGGLVLWVLLVGARTYRQPMPRFTRATPPVAQGGVAGRAAVLAAPTTHRGLVLLEQKNALEDELGALFGLAQTPSMGVLLDEVDRRKIVPRETFLALRKALLRVARVETAMASGVTMRVDRRTVLEFERVARVVSEAAARREGATP